MYIVYALKSTHRKYIYVGMTRNLENRLKRHNSGWEKTTKIYSPFVLIYKERHTTRREAINREKYLKSGTGKEFLNSL